LKEHPETFKEANIDKVLEKVRIGKLYLALYPELKKNIFSNFFASH